MRGMNEMVRQAQIMHKKMQKVQDELKEKSVEASSGGGMVTVEVTGGQELKSIKIDQAVLDDVEMLQDLVLAAVNEGLKKASEMSEAEMGQITGGLKMPGLF